MFEVGFGLGSNIGDKVAYVRAAAGAIEASGVVENFALSSLYRTAPWGNVDQDWFVNACAVGRTSLRPREVLDLCQTCEAEMGRERIVRWGPRTIDIDLLYCDGLVTNEVGLTLPHPEMLRRAFVLVPLAELRPDLIVAGTPIADALARLDTRDIVRLDA